MWVFSNFTGRGLSTQLLEEGESFFSHSSQQAVQ
jgi:hypothetical protein